MSTASRQTKRKMDKGDAEEESRGRAYTSSRGDLSEIVLQVSESKEEKGIDSMDVESTSIIGKREESEQEEAPKMATGDSQGTRAMQLFSRMELQEEPMIFADISTALQNPWARVKELVGDVVSPIDDSVLSEVREATQASTADSQVRVEEASNNLVQKPGDDNDVFFDAVADDGNNTIESDISGVAQEDGASPMDVDYEPSPSDESPTLEPILKPLPAGPKDESMDIPMSDADDSFNDSSDDEDEMEHEPRTEKGIDIRALASILVSAKESTRDITSESDVVLVLGATGTGKSTFIQAVAGHKFKSGWDQSLNRDCYVVDGQGEQGFDIGEGMRSRTRHVRSYFRESSSTFYVDSSGFGDTEGIETDVATSICVKDIASRCRRMRFVVLVNAYNFYLHRAKELRRHLDLVANFVGHNFGTYKKSFTFLFTHCNKAFESIPSKIEHGCPPTLVADMLATMRKELLHLLRSLKQDTDDLNLKVLVDFLKVSLKRGFPYCDVFDPMLSDVPQMVSSIEPSSDSDCIMEPASHVKCSLTSPAKLSLSHELSLRQEAILSSIEDDRYDEGFFGDVQATFTLTDHIGGDICGRAAETVQKALVACSADLKNRLFCLTRAGLLNDYASSFTLDDAQVLKATMDNLARVESLVSSTDENEEYHPDAVTSHLLRLVEQQVDGIEAEVAKATRCASSTEFVIQKEPPDLKAITTRLQKLRSFSQVFEGEGASMYEKAVALVRSGIYEVGKGVFGPDATYGPGVLWAYVILRDSRDLGLLDILAATPATAFAKPNSLLDKAKLSTVALLSEMKQLVETSVHCHFTVSSSVHGDVSSPRDVLGSIFVVQSIIDEYRLSLESLGARPLHESVELASTVFLQHAALCIPLIETLDCERGQLLDLCFQSLQSFVSGLPSAMQCGGLLIKSLRQLYHLLTSRLRELKGKLKMCTSTLEPTRLALNAASDKELLRVFHSCRWFDAPLRDALCEEAFVNQTFADGHGRYASFANDLVNAMVTSLCRLVDTDASEYEIEDSARFVSESMVTLRNVAFVIESNHPSEFSALAASRVVLWCDKIEQELVLPDSVHDLPFKDVDKLLLVAVRLDSVCELASHRIVNLRRRVAEKLADCATSVRCIMDSEGEFESKKKVLETAAKWSAFPRLLDYMPHLTKLRDQLRSEVVSYSQQLHTKISDTQDINIGDVEHDVAYLLDAIKHVDVLIGGEASKWADAIVRVLETRKQVDDRNFRSLIDDSDFVGVVAYLAPLKESGDARKKTQLRRLLKVLSTDLWQRIKTLQLIVKTPDGSKGHDVDSVKGRIEALEIAQCVIGDLFTELPPPSTVADGARWNLSDQIGVTRDIMQKTRKKCVIVAHRGIDKFDFGIAIESCRHASLLDHVITNGQGSRSVSDVTGKVYSMLSEVDELVEEFSKAVSDPEPASASGFLYSLGLRSGRSRSQPAFPPDTQKLRRSLGQLKVASVQSEGSETVSEIYRSAKHKLSVRLNALQLALQAEAREGRFSRPLKILSFLREELNARGLGEHCELNFDIDSATQDVNGMKSMQRQASRADFEDNRNLDRLATRLDRLHGYNGFFYQADYESECMAVEENVSEMVREIHAMIAELDFCELRRRITSVVRVYTKLRRHLKLSDKQADSMGRSFSLRSSAILQDMETSLFHNNLDAFQTLFRRIHTLMTNVPSKARTEGMPSSRRGFKALLGHFDETCRELQRNVSCMVLTETQKKIKTFEGCLDKNDYVNAAREAENLRNIGYFLVSTFELYRDEVCGDSGDSNFQKLVSLRRERFGSGRILDIGRHASILELASSPTQRDVRQAYKMMSQRWHPDKNHGNEKKATDKMVQINSARETLSSEEALKFYRDMDFRFLVDSLLSLSRSLTAKVRNELQAHEFRVAADIYEHIEEVTYLIAVARSDETTAKINIADIRDRIANLIREKANALRVDIQNAWTKQDFNELHHSFTTLEILENAFKSRNDIVSESFTSRVLKELNLNLEKLEAEFIDLRGADEKAAFQSMKKFGFQLIKIGRILDGFPRLKKQAKTVMSTILNNCHDEPWGVSFIFQLGLVLENGEISEDEDDTRVGQVIVNSFRHFDDVRTVIFNREVVTAPASESVRAMNSQVFSESMAATELTLNRNELKQEYAEYERLFNESFTKFVHQGHEQLVQSVYKLVSKVGPVSVSNWDKRIKAKLTRIVAGVFATFTIVKSGDSFRRFEEHNGADSTTSEMSHSMNLLFRPHNIQVLAILRLLGIGDPRSVLASQVMEVRTGEGKSIILGTLSVVLALLGFSVRCVCYSEHLSERDNELFRDTFIAFGIEDRIVYSKITTMSEDSVAAKGDIRKMTMELITGAQKNGVSSVARRKRSCMGRRPTVGTNSVRSLTREDTKTSSSIRASRSPNARQNDASLVSGQSLMGDNSERSSKCSLELSVAAVSDHMEVSELESAVRPPASSSSSGGAPLQLNGSEILLVDEVDVFMGTDFYGKTYNQIALLEDPTVEKLLRKIWDHRKQKPSFTFIKRWPEYQNLAAKFSEWELQIETEVRSMCADVGFFGDPPYEVDAVNGRIGYPQKDSVDWDLVFGYRTAFAHLHEAETGKLKGPKAKKSLSRALCLRVSCGQFSYARIAPARILGVSGTLRALTPEEKRIVREFGVDTYSFVPSVYGANNLSFDIAGGGIVIETELSRYFQTIANEVHLAVSKGRCTIVFFENDERLLEFQKSSFWRKFRHGNVLSSTTNKETRNYVIKKAATSGQVTIATAAFGRGTDFFCRDSKLEGAGGMLVIQSFLSVEKSEELQIQGRTARQGKKGSYMMVLLESDLCSVLGIRAGECASQPRAKLYQWLDSKRETVHKERLSETRELVQQAEERDLDSRAYLNALVWGERRDAKKYLDRMYEGIKSSNKHLKFCRMVCLSDATGSMSSIWSATKNCIREMLRRIDEIGEGQFELLWVAYRDYSDGEGLLEKSVWSRNANSLETFVSNIRCYGGGDEPEAVEWALKQVSEEHLDEPVTRALLIADAPPHPERCGESLVYHGSHVLATDYRHESERLKEKGIPVYTFRLNHSSTLVSSFEEISSITGGESHTLDFSSSTSGAQKLIDCVCETALEDIGGSELLAEYRARTWD